MSAGSPRFLSLCRETLGRGYSLRCSTLGFSMFPLLRTGSVIQVEPMAAADLRPGDVIVYQRAEEAVVAHRLVRKSWKHGRLTLVARGDSFPRSAREYINPEQVLGRVLAVDWGKGIKLRLDTACGRALGIFLGSISPLVRRVYPVLRNFGSRLIATSLNWASPADPANGAGRNPDDKF